MSRPRRPRYTQPTLDLGIAEWLDPLPAPWDPVEGEDPGEPEHWPLAEPPKCAWCEASLAGTGRIYICLRCGVQED